MSDAAKVETANEELAPRPGDALCVIDVQRDFLPGGALAVREGDAVVPVANRLVEWFVRHSLPVVVTRDWHPPNHCSFVEQGGPWPPHCVVDTPGAAFADGLVVPADAFIVSKGTSPDRDAYSDFEGSGLADWLRERGARRLFVVGIATDYCVLATVRDALRFDFDVVLLTDGIRAVDRNPGDGQRAIDEMQSGGARLATSDEVLRAAQPPRQG